MIEIDFCHRKRFTDVPHLKDKLRQTAEALAADRASKIFPMVVAQIIFMISIALALGRTADVAKRETSALNVSVYINIEAFSIAFSTLYFWIIPTVIFGSMVGVSQTNNAIPRILKRFQDDLNTNETLRDGVVLPIPIMKDDQTAAGTTKHELSDLRRVVGGIYSWNPSERSRSSNVYYYAPAGVIVLAGIVTAFAISSLVPPGGFNCRHIGELAITIVWLVSGWMNIFLRKRYPPNNDIRKIMKWEIRSRTMLFSATFIKDVVFALATLLGVIVVQIGVLNRCSCYTNWGLQGLALPQMHEVDQALQKRINLHYPLITTAGLGFQLVIVSGYIWKKYPLALQVYTQRDDDE